MCALAGGGCDPEPGLDFGWVRWLSHRAVLDAALTPEGGMVVAGHSLSNELAISPSYGQNTFRPFVMRLDPDGEPQWSEIGFLGAVEAVAVAADGGFYAITTEHVQLDDIGCELVAYAPDGARRWTRPARWAPSSEDIWHNACATDIATIGDRLVLAHHGALEILSEDGDSLVVEPLRGTFDGPLLASDEDVWAVERRFEDARRVIAARHLRADAERFEDVTLEGTERWTSLQAGAILADGLVVLLGNGDIQQPSSWLATYHDDGALAASNVLSLDDGDARRHATAILTTTPGDRWLLGVAEPRLSAAELETSPIPSLRIWARLLDARGHARGDLQRWFSEPQEAAPDRIACTASDLAPNARHGTAIGFALPRDDGRVLIAGRQHCRDSFVALVELR